MVGGGGFLRYSYHIHARLSPSPSVFFIIFATKREGYNHRREWHLAAGPGTAVFPPPPLPTPAPSAAPLGAPAPRNEDLLRYSGARIDFAKHSLAGCCYTCAPYGGNNRCQPVSPPVATISGRPLASLFTQSLANRRLSASLHREVERGGGGHSLTTLPLSLSGGAPWPRDLIKHRHDCPFQSRNCLFKGEIIPFTTTRLRERLISWGIHIFKMSSWLLGAGLWLDVLSCDLTLRKRAGGCLAIIMFDKYYICINVDRRGWCSQRGWGGVGAAH